MRTSGEYVKRANINAFGVDVDNYAEMQFTEYHGTENGHYHWHHDIHWTADVNSDRKLSITVQLSDPEDYEGGGTFEFDECETPADAKARGCRPGLPQLPPPPGSPGHKRHTQITGRVVPRSSMEMTMDTASKLEAHERECSIRYPRSRTNSDHIDKRLWRLEALMMASTLTIVAAAVGLFLK